MERKLIKQGGGGYTIYLPKKWIDARGLKEGDHVNVQENDNYLVIEGKISEKNDIEIELNHENKDNIKNILTNIYRNGYNKIIIKNADLDSFKDIKKATNLLLGFEITNHEGNKCIIENISEPAEDKYESVLRKVFFSIKDSFDLLINNFDNFSESYLEIEEMRDSNVKMILFCRRIVMKDKYSKNMALNWELLTFLSHIQKNLFYTYKYAHENKIKKDKNIIEMLEKAREHFLFVERAFYEKDSSYLEKLQKSSLKYAYKEVIDNIAKSDGKKSVIFAYNKELFRLIKVCGTPIRSILIS